MISSLKNLLKNQSFFVETFVVFERESVSEGESI